MSPFALREPVSALTHALGLVAALPTTWLLIRAAARLAADGPTPARAEIRKTLGLATFGFGMTACYGASAVYHAWPGSESTIELLRRFDMVGIFLLIAGTFTPSAQALMRPRPRLAAMLAVWGISTVCGGAALLGHSFPTWLATSIYLSLGWGMVLCYLDIRRNHEGRTLWLLVVGGALYTTGAIINLTRVRIAPGFDAHEVFHLFVLAGTATHAAFLFRVAVPALRPSPRATIPRTATTRARLARGARVDA